MLGYLKFWRTAHYLKQYLQEIRNLIWRTDHQRWTIRLVVLILALQLAHSTYICVVPLETPRARLAHYDPTLFWGCPQRINILTLSMCADILYLFVHTHWFDFVIPQRKLLLPSNLVRRRKFSVPLLVVQSILIEGNFRMFLRKSPFYIRSDM